MYLSVLAILVTSVACGPFTPLKPSDVDSNVASLTALKPSPVKKWHMEPVSVTKIDKKSQSGFMKEFQQSRNAVSENGELISSVAQTRARSQALGKEPHSLAVSEIEVPRLGIHDYVESKDGELERLVGDPHTAAALTDYVVQTGDQHSVVQFLQLLLHDGKISEEEVLNYVETIKKGIAEAEKMEKEAPKVSDDVERLRKMMELEEEEKEEQEEVEKAKALSFMEAELEKAEEESYIILKINDFLENSMKEGKIPRNLYNHLKDALRESMVDSMRQEAGSLASSDYGHY